MDRTGTHWQSVRSFTSAPEDIPYPLETAISVVAEHRAGSCSTRSEQKLKQQARELVPALDVREM
jgi:hypothetical protein